VEIYETEEEQVEALKRWWKENSTATMVGLAMGLVIILSWNYYQDYKKNQAVQASAMYDQLLKAEAENNKASIDKLAERMQQEFKGTEYAGFSGLIQAKAKYQQNDVAAAKQILKTIAAGPNKDLNNIAMIRLVHLMLDTGEFEQGLQLVNELDAKAAESYSANYDELVGDLYVALDRLDEARTSYQNASRKGKSSPLLQFKIDDLTAQEKLEAIKND
jgi:predicted negative regulator of RcsB-dependent stress response